ncbi:hypothetical protein [Arcobacter sp. F2176]|uniref:hypothetical protein n=1 Tax=Arcobacter sp. F2176 TaxID=2044511 RepID=UPI00100C0348|nr:hypothetical protein [Arcobacter sp. F2176]RXJ80514.1 hypothetical protein CRU95_11060 [Arcobacter sp. F2176]
MIDTILNFINQGWVGTSIGIIGIIIGAILSYRFSIKKPIPAYQEHSLEIIRKNQLELSKDIKILFNEQQVDNLTKIQIVFWNHGTDTLRIENIVKDDPLLFKFSQDAIILSSKIIKKSRDINKSFIKNSESDLNIAYFGFDYLDQNDGIVFEIIHTDIKSYPEVKGTFKGIPEGIQNFGQVNLNTRKCTSKLSCLLTNSSFLLFFTSFLGITIMLMGIYPSVYEKINSINDLFFTGNTKNTFIIIFGFLYFILPLFIFWQKRKRFPKSLVLTDD